MGMQTREMCIFSEQSIRNVHGHRPATRLALVALLALACTARAPRLKPTDEALTTYLTSVHDWMQMTNRHAEENEMLMRKLSARYRLSGASQLAQDPELVAQLNRQREEMAAVVAGTPVGPMAAALGTTIGGIGHGTLDGRRMTFLVEPNDSALAAARARYGETFVDWVLARKGRIIATLSQ
jgi:hypothetical protein